MIFHEERKRFCDGKMKVNLLPSIVIMTALVFGTLSFSFHTLWSFFEHNLLIIAQTDDSIESSPFSLSSLIKSESPYFGDLSAPITIVDFSDFQCHLCARYVKNTEPLINETYIQTGKVVLVFKTPSK